MAVLLRAKAARTGRRVPPVAGQSAFVDREPGRRTSRECRSVPVKRRTLQWLRSAFEMPAQTTEFERPARVMAVCCDVRD